MTILTFHSCLAQHFERFVALARSVGKDYDSQGRRLVYFDRFLVSEQFNRPFVTRDIVDRYLGSISHVAERTRGTRLCVLRRFCRYLALYEPECYVPDRLPVAQSSFSRIPFTFTRTQVVSLLAKASELSAIQSPLRPNVYRTLFGLLYSTGIRIGEALALDIKDVDLGRQQLLVREGKFHKSRWIPFASSTCSVLSDYLDRRTCTWRASRDAPFFVSWKGRRLPHRSAAGNFRLLVEACDIRKEDGTYPRIHDLRHTFACHRLLEWYRDGENINARLPALTTYMGHVDLRSTQRYLHATPELMEEVNRRFLKHYRENIKCGGLS